MTPLLFRRARTAIAARRAHRDYLQTRLAEEQAAHRQTREHTTSLLYELDVARSENARLEARLAARHRHCQTLADQTRASADREAATTWSRT